MKRLSVRCSKQRDDWLEAKRVFVNAFLHYPLYKYFVPDRKMREEFLNRYMEANYEMTVVNGCGILVCVELHEDEEETDDVLSQIPNQKSKIIGSTIFVYPSEDGVGWCNKEKDAYSSAYARMGVTDMLDDGIMKRIEAYEKWEYEELVQKLDKAKQPLCNGLYCSIDPKYSSLGMGSLIFADVIDLLCQHNIARQIYADKLETTGIPGKAKQVEMKPGTLPYFTPCSECFNVGEKIQNGNPGQLSAFLDYYYRVCKSDLAKAMGNDEVHSSPETNKKGKKIIIKSYSTSIFARLIHRFGLLNHHAIVIPAELQTNCGRGSSFDDDSAGNATNQSTFSTPKNGAPLIYARKEQNCFLENAPFVGAITHCKRSATFYERNGFNQTFHKPYIDAESNTILFDGYLLFADPFKTEKLANLTALFEGSKA